MSVVRLALQCGVHAFGMGIRSNEHGVPHWVRVWNNARRLAEIVPGVNPGYDMHVLAWFAFLHDCKRRDDGADPGHGQRAYEYAKGLWHAGRLALDPDRMLLLREALVGHSAGYLESDPVVKVCWDADRLDLVRFGVRPDPRRMCTEEGARMARWASSTMPAPISMQGAIAPQYGRAGRAQKTNGRGIEQ